MFKPKGKRIALGRVLLVVLIVVAALVLMLLLGVAVRLGYAAVTGPSPKGDALKALWAFVAAGIAAAVTLTGVVFTHAQAERSESRLAVESAVRGLELIPGPERGGYAAPGVVAGALAALVHLGHPGIAMRVLGASWAKGVVDIPTATWLISEVLASRVPQAQLEAAAMLDAHAEELCADRPGQFSWPASIEFEWMPSAPLPARLRLFRAVLRTLLSRERSWWQAGGREGWAVGLLYDAARKDRDRTIRIQAARATSVLLVELKIRGIQSAKGWIHTDEIKPYVTKHAGKTFKYGSGAVMLRLSFEALERWAAPKGNG